MREDRVYSFKIGWYRQRAGRITITGKRRGGTNAQPLIRATWASYPAPGVLPSTLVFGQKGCWDVTARQGGATVTVTVAVYDTPRKS